MPSIPDSDTLVTVTTHEVLPKFGIAFLQDGEDRTWTVTRSTKGPGLDVLRPGQQLRLKLIHRPDFTSVIEYELLS